MSSIGDLADFGLPYVAYVSLQSVEYMCLAQGAPCPKGEKEDATLEVVDVEEEEEPLVGISCAEEWCRRVFSAIAASLD